jgi:hypothetical protein
MAAGVRGWGKWVALAALVLLLLLMLVGFVVMASETHDMFDGRFPHGDPAQGPD